MCNSPVSDPCFHPEPFCIVNCDEQFCRMENRKLRVAVTGASGMVGEGVVHECLNHPEVESVAVIGRRTCGISHPRLREILIPDFSPSSLEAVRQQLSGLDASFFCLGVTSVGKKEPEYTRLTYDLTMDFARIIAQENPGSIFCYVSGSGTDSTEKGRSMWARVKGKTENDLRKLSFRNAFAFRPGYIHPTSGLKHTQPMYRYVAWAYPFWRKFFPGFVSTLREVGLAMIHVARAGNEKNILEVPDINLCAAREEEFLRMPPAPVAPEQPAPSQGILPDRDLKKNLGCG